MKIETIAAISTPAGHGGIGIIRLSGPDAIPMALSVFKPGPISANPPPFPVPGSARTFPVSRHLYYGHVYNINFEQIIDEALFAVMRGPRSYTGEDVAELQTHAGPFVLQKTLKTLLHNGARLAEAGEFTRRAFLNGRIDLTQAEAVIDIINARSDRSLALSMSMVSGDLKQIITALRDSIWDTLSFIEAGIDFPDDMAEENETVSLFDKIENHVIPEIQGLIRSFDSLNFLRDGLRVVIVGGPNVGKSSLLNRLINKDRAIVSDIPGTTRDFIEESFTTNGVPIVVTDTAGMRDNPDTVEQIGIDKAWKLIHDSDIILFTLDAGRTIQDEDLSLFNKLAEKKIVLVVNKTDLPNDQICLSLPKAWKEVDSVRISALRNQGIDALKEKIAHISLGSTFHAEQKIVPNLRQKILLEKALQSLQDAQNGNSRAISFELISIDLRAALNHLSEITGEAAKQDILNAIFTRFCIGK